MIAKAVRCVTDISSSKELMKSCALEDKKKLRYRINTLLKRQLDNFAREEGLAFQAVIARAVNFAHPRLSDKNRLIVDYSHLRRREMDETSESTTITPLLTEETLTQIEDVRLARNVSPALVVSESLKLFFKDLEKQAAGTFQESALSAFRAPTYYLSDERFNAPWIEPAPSMCTIKKDNTLVLKSMEGRTIYVGADFFLTMMTALEKKHGPRNRLTPCSEDVLKIAAHGEYNLVTSAGEFNRMVGLGGALLEARDKDHFAELVSDFDRKGIIPPFGAPKMAERMQYLSKLGVRIVPPELADYTGAVRFMKSGAGSDASFTTLLGLSTMNNITPGESIVMLRFLSKGDKPLMLVWQEFAEDGRLQWMSSVDVSSRACD